MLLAPADLDLRKRIVLVTPCPHSCRPGRLTDGPYTSYDLNTLLKATAGDRRAVELALSDRLGAETSRIAVAGEASCCVTGPCTLVQQWAVWAA